MLKLKCSKSSYNIFQHSQVIVINPLLQKLLRNEYVLKLWIFFNCLISVYNSTPNRKLSIHTVRIQKLRKIILHFFLFQTVIDGNKTRRSTIVILPGFCFTPKTSVLIQNLLWLVFPTNRSHLVKIPSQIKFLFSVFLSPFPWKN